MKICYFVYRPIITFSLSKELHLVYKRDFE